MNIEIVVAVAQGRVIGKDGKLPWKLPADLRRFRQLTMGYPVIMGRKTFESIGKPLGGRMNIVLSRTWRPMGYEAGMTVVGSLGEALEFARGHAVVVPEKCFIIGGAEVYEQALPITDTIHATAILDKYEGDAHFPDIGWRDWALMKEESHGAGPNGEPAHVYLTYQRKVHDA